MKGTDDQRRRRFDTLFAAYSPGIVAYSGWRADSASDAQDPGRCLRVVVDFNDSPHGS